MADEREISLKIRVEGVSNEASELAKLQAQFKALNEERARFLKEVSSKGIMSNQDKLVLAAYNRDLKQTKDSIKELSTVVDTHEQSVKRMRAEYNKLKDIYYSVDAATREKMLPGINKLYGEITKAEQAAGVFSRNVGNYPQVMGTAAGGIKELTGAVGGNTAAVGDAITSFATAGGAAGVFTVAMGTLAAAWKRVQENIELYLKSADKLQYSFAGYERDSEKALDDYRKRLRGQEAAGVEAEMKARALLVNRGHLLTEEEKEGLRIQIEKGQNMQTEARTQLNLLRLDVERGKWKLEYNKLAQEEESLNDEKLLNETKWLELETQLTHQRAIVTAQESTAAEKAAATVKADELAAQLKKEKTEFLDREIVSLIAISELTETQEAVEDRLNALQRERANVAKEYENTQIRINRMERTAGKDGKIADFDIAGFNTRAKDEFDNLTRKNQEDFEKEAEKQYDEIKINEDRILQYRLDNITEEERAKKEANDREVKAHKEKEDKKKELSNAAQQGVMDGIQAGFNFKKAKLQAEMEAELSNQNLTEQQKDAIRRKYAREQQRIDIQQAIANGAAAIVKNISQMGFLAAIPINVLTAIQTGIQVATIKAQKYETGGKINNGVPVYIPGSRDNLLIAANNSEAVINERQIAALGGTRAMRAAGVPGFESGGAIGNMPYINPSMPASSSDILNMSNRLSQIEVHLDMHKVRSGLNELDVTLQPQRI